MDTPGNYCLYFIDRNMTAMFVYWRAIIGYIIVSIEWEREETWNNIVNSIHIIK